MKHWIPAIAVVFSMTSCQGEKEKNSTSETLTESAAPVVLTTDYREVEANKTDFVFDDFLLTYATDSATQWQRTRFPLPYIVDGLHKEIPAERWEMDPLYSVEDSYTLLFNTEEDMDLPTRTDLQESTFEWIDPDKDRVKQYIFRRNEHTAWILDAIAEMPLIQNPNAEFLTFYAQFVNDPEFRRDHVRRKVVFITNFTDDNDGFNMDNFTVDADQWLAWDVLPPLHKLSNIVYGPSTEDKEPTLKIMCIKSLDGAFFKALYFRKHPVLGWQLFKYEDTAY